MNQTCALIQPVFCGLDRVLEIDRFLVHFALKKPHTTAVLEIDGGDDQHKMDNGQWRIDNDRTMINADVSSTIHSPLSIIHHEAAEIGQNPEPQLLALFRVKLASKEPVGRDTRREGTTIIRDRRDHGRVVGNDIERMDEIDIIAVRNAFQKRRVFPLLDSVPAHVRHFQIFASMDANYFAGKKIEPFLLAKFLAFGKKQLEAKADP